MAGSERRKRLHDARELGLDAFGKHALEGQIRAEPTLHCDPVHVTGLLQRRGSLVQVVASQLADAPVAQAAPFFFLKPQSNGVQRL